METAKVEVSETAVALEPIGEVAGADEFLARAHDAESLAVFDITQHDKMASGMDKADKELKSVNAEKQKRREQTIGDTQEKMRKAEQDASKNQDGLEAGAKTSIQAARQEIVEEQAAKVDSVKQNLSSESEKATKKIDARITEDQSKLKTTYDQAEKEAEAKKTEAQKDIDNKKKEAEDASENKSWWERGKAWVGSQLSKIGEAFGKLFTKLFEDIDKVIAKAKKVGGDLIDAGAKFAKKVVSGLGKLAKTAVNNVVGKYFPETAKKLNALIDNEVKAFNNKIDLVAKKLKTGLNALLDVLGDGLKGVLKFVQGALNGIIAIAQAALKGDWGEVARIFLEGILSTWGISLESFYAFFGKAMDVLLLIYNDPWQFLQNLFNAVMEGFNKFGDNFLEHLTKGFFEWLTGAFAGTLRLPTTFDLVGLLDLAAQILGLTYENIRTIAVDVFGESAVEKVEHVFGYVKALITEGWSSLFEKIKDDLSGLYDIVVDQITSYLETKIVQAGIVLLVSMLNPVTGLIRLVMAIWKFVTWVITNLGRFKTIFETIVNGIVNIAKGIIEPAALKVESAIALLIAPIIDLLAGLLLISGVTDQVKKIISQVRKKITAAIKKFITKIGSLFTGKKKKKGDSTEEADDDLMTDVKFSADGESHRLYVVEKGDDVVPMVASDPTPVALWLNQQEERHFKKGGDLKKKGDEDVVALIRTARDQLGILDGLVEKNQDEAEKKDLSEDETEKATRAGEILKETLIKLFMDDNNITKPLHVGGIARQNSGFMLKVLFFAHQANEAITDNDKFVTNKLISKVGEDTSINAPLGRLIAAIAEHPDNGAMWAEAIEPEIIAAAKMKTSKKNPQDYSIFVGFKAINFRETTENKKFLKKQYRYFEKQDEAGKGVGDGALKDLNYFFTKSPRARGNKDWVSDKLRDAKPKSHEWIPVSLFTDIVNQVTESMSDENLHLVGNLLQMQHKLRTPTSKVIFDYDYIKGNHGRFGYIGTEHLSALSNDPSMKLDDGYKKFNAPITTLQGHNKLYVTQIEDNKPTKREANAGSYNWHEDLKKRLRRAGIGRKISGDTIHLIEKFFIRMITRDFLFSKDDEDVFEKASLEFGQYEIAGIKYTNYKEAFDKAIEITNIVIGDLKEQINKIKND